MMLRFRVTALWCLFGSIAIAQQPIKLKSPSGNLLVTINTGDSIRYSISSHEKTIVLPSAIALQKENGQWLGIQSKLAKSETRSVRDSIVNLVPYKRRVIPDRFNEITFRFKENFSIIFRAYDDGVAYRFKLQSNDSVTLKDELAQFRFTENPIIYFPEVQKRENADIFHTSFEENYAVRKLKDIATTNVAFTPVLLETAREKIFVTESDLLDYPGMFVSGSSSSALHGFFAGYPLKEEFQGGEFKQWVVTQRRDYIAKVKGSRILPWRVIGIAQKDEDLLINDIVYRLASAPAKTDWSWVKPGKCTDEWICGINLHQVPFKAGINTETYKYYIDFAARFKLDYVMLDAGWSDYEDLLKITPGLNLEELARYAKEKGIGLALWTLAATLDKQLEPALTEFNRLGIKFIMTDFMDRDDQPMTRFYERVAEACAKHKIMAMFHGAFKNAGFERTYPHILTREGVLGSEYNIWSDRASPEHDLILPFTRMLSGPMDYEPGFFENASQKFFRPQPERVVSQGTRCHQLAMFLVYESPFQVFSGNPSDAWLEPDYMEFLGSFPTVWDQTQIISARVSDYAIIARKKGNTWYVAGMTDWTAREFTINLNFLDKGQYILTGYEDGLNSEKNPRDYRHREALVDKTKSIQIKMAPGGGFAFKIEKK
jgi:alpha-glucosidase